MGIYYCDEKDMVSELLYNFKLCPGRKCNKKSLFHYASTFKGISSIIYKKPLQYKSVLLYCLN